jgi:arylsulfatase A-like enzyme
MKNFSKLLVLTAAAVSCATPEKEAQKPNIIYILADDLGYGDLGINGQEKIQTPNLDRMAAEGMVFTQHYSGATVCAPSRSSLLTGLHGGHTYIRGNSEIQPEGQAPLPAEAYTIAEMMKEAGYATGAFGKWGLGMGDTEGSPNAQGFDEFLGYLCQRVAHRYYPKYLWHNRDTFYLEGNDWTNKVTYAPDVLHEHAKEFIRTHKDKPFFLYLPYVAPHAELIAPEDTFTRLYEGKFEETPFGFVNPKSVHGGNDYGAENFAIEGYAPQAKPRTVFAAMVSRLDHQVGEVLDLLQELGIAENTLVIFTSDNGPHKEGGADPVFFGSAGPFKGFKRDLYEGGIRVPFIAWWPGKVAANTKTDHISAFWDFMPTMAELAGVEIGHEIDGISYLPTLLGKKGQQEHEYLYFEFHELGGRQAIRKGDWKFIKYNVSKAEKTTTELYNLADDPGEGNNVADQNPALVEEFTELLKTARTPSERFNFDTGFKLVE